jgi:hypothetical protein
MNIAVRLKARDVRLANRDDEALVMMLSFFRNQRYSSRRGRYGLIQMLENFTKEFLDQTRWLVKCLAAF